jgi:putative spermidine/putrescine transport system ATP-binding protein
VHVTHTQPEAIALADTVVVMNQGSIEQAASPHDVYANPRSSYVARFMGGQNVLTGKLRGTDGDSGLVDGPGGARFRVPMNGAAKPAAGAQVNLAVRRDLINLRREQGAGDPKENSLHGTVETVEYQGIFFKVTLSRIANEEFIVIEPEATYFSHPVAPGDAVVVSWGRESLRLLEPDRAAGDAVQPYADDRSS